MMDENDAVFDDELIALVIGHIVKAAGIALLLGLILGWFLGSR